MTDYATRLAYICASMDNTAELLSGELRQRGYHAAIAIENRTFHIFQQRAHETSVTAEQIAAQGLTAVVDIVIADWALEDLPFDGPVHDGDYGG